MNKASIIALILACFIAVPAAVAQNASCNAITPSNTVFNAALIGSNIAGSTTGFANVNFSLTGTQATVIANSLGLGNNITGITLFQGTPGNLTVIPIQSFNVVFFRDEGLQAADLRSLLIATPESKRKTFEFLDTMSPHGQTDPIPALEAVAKMQPELIYLLTDGDFSGPGNQAVVDYCQKTFGAKTKINTIAFIARESKDNPQDLEYVKVLQQIAKTSGGKFKYVTDDDLGQK